MPQRTLLAGLILLLLVPLEPAQSVELRNGDLVVVDAGREGAPIQPPRVIRVDPATGAQELIAESGLLQAPIAVAVEAPATIFVSDAGAGAVLRIDAVSGQQTILEGSFQGLLGLARDPESGDLFATDTADQAIYRVDPISGGKTPVSTGGLLGIPQAVAVAPSGLLFLTSFADIWRVVEVDPGSGSQTPRSLGFSFPSGIAVGSNGTVWVVDATEATVIAVNPSTGGQTPLPAGSELVQPFAVSLAANDLMVTDWGGGGDPPAVVRKNATTGTETLVTSGGLLTEPWGVATVPEPEVPATGLVAAAMLAWLRGRGPRAGASKPSPAGA